MCTPEPSDRDVVRSPLRSRPFVLLLLAAGGMFFGFALLVSVVPLWVVEHGSGEFSAGAVTAVFMTSTVLAQLMMSTLVRRFGYRAMAITGAALLGAPASLLMLFTDWQPVLAVSFVRGVGFGIVTVCGSALIAELLPRGMLAKGSGVFGLAVGLPLLVGLPAGAWLAQNAGFAVVFLTGAALPMLGIVPLALLPRTTAQPEEDGRGTVRAARAVWRPWLVMLSGSVAFGALVTFLPLVFVESPLAGSLALLLMSATALVGRWLAGIWGDSARPTGKLLVAGLAATSTGLLGLAVGAGVSGTAALVLGVSCVAVYGAGFGVIQNDALVVMFARVSAARASVAWNIAFDAGQGAGAAVVGAVVTLSGFPVAFAMLAALAIVLVPVAWPRARYAVR
ncbi:Predicted arabinose efflux permease, MFS family [Haloechinothrix alba]|uniref:Predicted arabinose efflux permease, MFS family n=1 Tax=Haloechinothrix alba TaxID=664784 RepID=A0A238WJ63_9PSEU|nr:MFS transporter [Haloechinothrix alba]SNR46488.1 Predicted arabinose efflux permease, MFS family [Haloechinothrix alba]